jgi:hypothetical protein
MRFLLLPVLFLGLFLAAIVASLIGFAVLSKVLIFFGFDYPFDEARECSTGIGEGGACFARVHLTQNGPVRSRPRANSLAAASRETAGPLQRGPTLYLPFVRARIFKKTLRIRLWPQREREVPLAALTLRRGGVVGPLDLLGLWGSCAFQWKIGNASVREAGDGAEISTNASGTISLSAHRPFVRELEEAVKRVAADAA